MRFYKSLVIITLLCITSTIGDINIQDRRIREAKHLDDHRIVNAVDRRTGIDKYEGSERQSAEYRRDLNEQRVSETRDRRMDETRDRRVDETPERRMDETRDRRMDETRDRRVDETPERRMDETRDRRVDETRDRRMDETDGWTRPTNG
ncbi:serine/threonine-protein kinase fray2-like [Oppia nitens]|uniref:serine/threonine-protein kinase fray2-like n=1 Tax=Oppia nitens TaxID=1686743 RepID=UPI0023DAB641|nr:serine/threonine-protein kinase fray2-like [Oppia nitens]